MSRRIRIASRSPGNGRSLTGQEVEVDLVDDNGKVMALPAISLVLRVEAPRGRVLADVTLVVGEVDVAVPIDQVRLFGDGPPIDLETIESKGGEG